LEVPETPIVAASSPHKKRTDTELVNMCLNGDSSAWEALIKRYRRMIYYIPVKFGFSPPDASDVFQNVCLKLLEHLHEFKNEGSIRGWLATITARHCMSIRSEKQRETPTADEEFEDQLDPSLTLEEIRLLAETQQELRDCVNRLPSRCSALINMLYFEDHTPSYQQISEILGIPVGAIAPNRNRCLEKLKKIFRERGIK